MKKLFLVFGVMVLATSATFVACKKDNLLQANHEANPAANKEGAFTANTPEYERDASRIISSTEYIVFEIKSGKLTDYSQTSIDQYAEVLDLGRVSSDMVSTIYKTVSNPELNFRTELDKLNLSDLSKAVITDVFTNAEAMPIEAYQRFLTRKTDEIKSMKVNAAEQQKLLTICTMAFQATNSDILKDNRSDGNKIGGMTTMGSPGGVLAGVIIGGGLGFLVGGPAGAVVGAAAGFAIGAK